MSFTIKVQGKHGTYTMQVDDEGYKLPDPPVLAGKPVRNKGKSKAQRAARKRSRR